MLKVIKIKGHAQSGKTTMAINWLINAIAIDNRPQGVLVVADHEKAEYVKKYHGAAVVKASGGKVRICAAKDYLLRLQEALCTQDQVLRNRKLDEVIGAVAMDDANTFDPVTLSKIRFEIKQGAKLLSAGLHKDPMLLLVKTTPLERVE